MILDRESDDIDFDVMSKCVDESGWQNKVDQMCLEIIKNNPEMSLDNILKELGTKSKDLIQEGVKKKVCNHI